MSYKAENAAEGVILVNPLKPLLVRVKLVQCLVLLVQMQQILIPVLNLAVLVLGQQEPVYLALLAPFAQLGEFLSHEQELLARMSHHEGICHLQIGKLIEPKSRHLVEHRALEMHDLVMREHQDIILAVGIFHGKCHHVMRVLAEQRIQLHVLRKVVHPAHVPFQGKAQAVVLRLARHLRPCRGLLGNHQRTRVPAQQNGI